MKGKYTETHKPEYETVLALGGLCMNKDTDSIFYLNELLNRAGMDSISAGAVVAFAIECFENGLLTVEDTDGLELEWGNPEVVKKLIEKMIDRDGIGDKCDDKDDRLLESNRWLVIGIIVLITLIFGVLIFRMIRKLKNV